ncbi:MAG TPA: hypothetical protein VGJ31_07155 [Dongiaceae bacterium]
MTASLRSALRTDMMTDLRSVPGSAFPDMLSVPLALSPGLIEEGMTPIVPAAWPIAPGGFHLRLRHPAGERHRMLQQTPGRTLHV